MDTKRQNAPLEVSDVERRKEIHSHLQSMMHLVNDRSLGSIEVSCARVRLIFYVARELLGDDADFEVLC